jgi:hypothetical protein
MFLQKMIRSLLFLSGLLTAFTTAANTVAVSDCGVHPILKITDLSFSPTAPIPGQNGTLFTHYEVPYEITAGVAKYTCTLNGFPVLSDTYDLCTQTKCPLTVGHHDDTSESAIPDVKGTIVCKIKWETEKAEELLCIQTKFLLV